MLHEQDTCQILDALHDGREEALGKGLRFREVLAIHLREQDYYLH